MQPQHTSGTTLRVSLRLVTGLAVLVMILSFQSATALQETKDCSSGFKQGAEQFVQVQYRTKTRKGSAKKDVTEAEVLWQPQDMLTDPSCYDLKQTTLLYKPVLATFIFILL
jgi:hypothetical protein